MKFFEKFSDKTSIYIRAIEVKNNLISTLNWIGLLPL